MAVAFVDHSALVLVVAASRTVADPVLDHLFDQGIAFGFSRPADLAQDRGRLAARYRVALILDSAVDASIRDAGQALARELPCVLVSDAPVAGGEPFREVAPTDTSAARLFERVRGVLAECPAGDRLVGAAPAMQRLRRQIERVAHRSTPVLVQGETGVGKEMLAREIHRQSGRSGAFVVLDCAGVVDSQVDAELFGVRDPHDPGPGSGCLARAQGGTLLLDDVARMSSLLQARLLRLLASGHYRRTGESQPRALDVRVIATTRGCLAQAVEAGRLRPDLFHSLAVFPVRVPPLRERTDDIVGLIDALAADRSIARPRLDARAVARLEQHCWPGNVRELANIVERLAIVSPCEVIDAALLDAYLDPLWECPAPPDAGHACDTSSPPDAQIAAMTLPGDGVDLRALVARLEKQFIEQALDHNAYVVAHAARALGLRRTTLTEKLRRYGISTD